jgi:hypothetical protein
MEWTLNNMHKGASNKIDNIKGVIETFYEKIKKGDPALNRKIEELQEKIKEYQNDKDKITDALYKLAAETASIPMNNAVKEGLKVLNITCVKKFIEKLPDDIDSIDPDKFIKLLDEVFVLDAISKRAAGVIKAGIFSTVDKQCSQRVVKFNSEIQKLKKSSKAAGSILAGAVGHRSHSIPEYAAGSGSGGGGAKKRKYTKRKKRKTAKRKKKKTAKRKKRKRRKATRAKK